MLGDQVDLHVLAEQGPSQRPALVVAGRVGPPPGLVGDLGDAGRELLAHEIEQGEGSQHLAVRIGGVLDDGQFGGVAEDLVQHVEPVTLRGHDDPGAEGGVLVGHMAVGGHALVGEVPGQGPGGERLAPHRQAQTVGG